MMSGNLGTVVCHTYIMHHLWDMTDGPAMVCGSKKISSRVSPPNKAAAKGSLKSYFRLQLLQKFIRCVCQLLMKLLMIEAASSTDLSFLPGAQSTPAV